jgi:hypothetical protein
MQNVQKLRTFYETIIFGMFMVLGMLNGAKPLSV